MFTVKYLEISYDEDSHIKSEHFMIIKININGTKIKIEPHHSSELFEDIEKNIEILEKDINSNVAVSIPINDMSRIFGFGLYEAYFYTSFGAVEEYYGYGNMEMKIKRTFEINTEFLNLLRNIQAHNKLN